MDALKADLEEEEDEDEEIEEIKPVELPSNSWDIYNVEQLKLYFKGPNHDLQEFARSTNQIEALCSESESGYDFETPCW